MGTLGKSLGLALALTCLSNFADCADDIHADAAKAILIHKCGVCHRGPFLDMTDYPFHSSEFYPEPVLFEEFARRIEKQGFGVMPPVNGAPLTAEEKQSVLRWLRQTR